MALPSARVGVNRTEVDADGKIKSSATNNIELRYDTDTDKPQYREKGTEEWLNFSGGVAQFDLDEDYTHSMIIAIAQNSATPLTEEDITLTIYEDSSKTVKHTITMTKCGTDGALAVINYKGVNRSQVMYAFSIRVNHVTNVNAISNYSSNGYYYSYTVNQVNTALACFAAL